MTIYPSIREGAQEISQDDYNEWRTIQQDVAEMANPNGIYDTKDESATAAGMHLINEGGVNYPYTESGVLLHEVFNPLNIFLGYTYGDPYTNDLHAEVNHPVM